MAESELILVTGSSNPKLAKKIGEQMNPKIEVHNGIDRRFADGETRVQIPVSVRAGFVFVIQSTSPPNVPQAYDELGQLLDASRRAWAIETVAVIPYFGYARQDRKDRPRTAITASKRAKEIEEAGARGIIVIDLHSEAVEGSTKIPWDKLYASYTLIPAIQKLHLPDPVVVSPDIGGLKRAVAYSEKLGLGEDVAVVYKRRDPVTGESEATRIIGDVSNRDVLLVDDIADTLGTLTNAANFVKDQGARDVYAAVTHGIFSNDALSRLQDSAIRRLLITDTISARGEVENHPQIEIHSVAPLLAKAIEYNLSGKSISADLIR